MVNIELLRKTLEAIKANPEHWDQGVWRCSTGMCFAGWASQLAGAVYLVPMKLADSTRPVIVGSGVALARGRTFADVVMHESIEGSAYLWDADGRDVQMPHTARAENFAERALGLTSDQAAALFHSDNTLDALELMVERLAADPDADLDDLVPDDGDGND